MLWSQTWNQKYTRHDDIQVPQQQDSPGESTHNVGFDLNQRSQRDVEVKKPFIQAVEEDAIHADDVNMYKKTQEEDPSSMEELKYQHNSGAVVEETVYISSHGTGSRKTSKKSETGGE